MHKYIRDRYFRERGSQAKIIDLFCVNCKSRLLVYQKDGPGDLVRCYLNRIIDPIGFLPDQKLVCHSCGSAVATPMVYSDGRSALLLRQHLVYRRKSDIDKEYE